MNDWMNENIPRPEYALERNEDKQAGVLGVAIFEVKVGNKGIFNS